MRSADFWPIEDHTNLPTRTVDVVAEPQKRKLSDAVREYRKKRRLTQVELAELLQSSQSRVAKVEAADESVSLDLLVRSLLALGATHKDLAKVITGRVARAS